MKWTYDKVRRYAEVQRKRAYRGGCRECGKISTYVELTGFPSLWYMLRNGYGIDKIKAAIQARGWFCRGCARRLIKEKAESKLREWKKKQQQQFPKPVLPSDKREWPDSRKWDYVYDICNNPTGQIPSEERAREVWAGNDLARALEILKTGY